MSEVDPEALQQFRDAIHDLYRASVGIDRASATDAADRLREVSGADRLFRLHAIASSLNRGPELALGSEESEPLVEAFARAIEVGSEDIDIPRRDARVEGIKEFAALTSRDRRGLTRQRWVTFLAMTHEPGFEADTPEAADAAAKADAVVEAGARAAVAAGALTPSAAKAFPLLAKPGCNDSDVVEAPAGAAATVRSRFWIDLGLDDAGKFIDPRNWVQYGRPFWKQMAVVGALRESTKPTGFSGVFQEIVDLPLGEVTVHLEVNYERADDYVVCDYRLAGPAYANDDVTVDSGWLFATRGDDPAVGGTYVEGLKAIRFAEEAWNDYPDLSCDGGWVYFMINMALGGDALPMYAHDPVTHIPYLGPPPDDAEVVAGLDRVVDDWVKSASKSLAGHGTDTKAALHRILAPDYDPRWVNDVIGMGHGAVSTTKSTLDAWRKALEELGKLGGKP